MGRAAGTRGGAGKSGGAAAVKTTPQALRRCGKKGTAEDRRRRRGARRGAVVGPARISLERAGGGSRRAARRLYERVGYRSLGATEGLLSYTPPEKQPGARTLRLWILRKPLRLAQWIRRFLKPSQPGIACEAVRATRKWPERSSGGILEEPVKN